jgi:hypothetical protein
LEGLTNEEDMIFQTKPKLFSIGIIIVLDETISLLSIGVSEITINEEYDPKQRTLDQGTTEVVPSTTKPKDYYVRLEISLEDKVDPETYYDHNQADIEMDETPTKIQVQNHQIIGWTLTKEQQLVKLNLGIETNPQCIKVNAQLIKEKIEELHILLKEFKDVFA